MAILIRVMLPLGGIAAVVDELAFMDRRHERVLLYWAILRRWLRYSGAINAIRRRRLLPDDGKDAPSPLRNLTAVRTC